MRQQSYCSKSMNVHLFCILFLLAIHFEMLPHNDIYNRIAFIAMAFLLYFITGTLTYNQLYDGNEVDIAIC